MSKKTVWFLISLLLIATSIVIGIAIGAEKTYAYVIMLAVIFSLIPFYSYFDKKVQTKNIVVIGVMIALSVVSRTAFYFVPHFKPLCAMVIITGIYLGAYSGFLCGSLSAFISGFVFGLGPWIPFQMLSFGMIGIISGLFSKALKTNKAIMILFSVFMGFLYLAIVDIWTAVWIDGTLLISRYLFLLFSALQISIIYAVSNVIFMILLMKPIGKKIERFKIKYNF